MPVLIPIIVGVAAYGGATFAVGAMVTAGIVAAGSLGAIVAGVVVGAVIGAAVGALGAAVTGGDIGKGALWGALGGAVAGGFAGFGAAGGGGGTVEGGLGSTTGNVPGAPGEALTLSKSGAFEGGTVTGAGNSAGMSTGEGLMYSSGISTAGDALAGWAAGEAMDEKATTDAAAAKEQAEIDFQNKMKELAVMHEGRLKEIGIQNEAQMALADKNNASGMEQLNTRIGADKAVVDAANQVEADKIRGFNDSVRGIDEELFDRPMLTFNPSQENDSEFDASFLQASSQSPNMTPEEIEMLKQQQATA